MIVGLVTDQLSVPSAPGSRHTALALCRRTLFECHVLQRGLMRQSDLIGQDFSEKAIALDLARDVALKTETPFPAIGKRVAGLYDEDRPIWYEDRHRVMNQRPCDHEERGIRAWKIH